MHFSRVDFMSGDNINSNLSMDNSLLATLQSLLKRDVLSKPAQFTKEFSIKKHLSIVDDYCQFVQATKNLDKCLILWESLDEDIKNEVLFDKEYEANRENFTWLKSKLMAMCPEKANNVSNLVNLLQIKQCGRTLDAYLVQVKQECAKCRTHFSSEELQTIAVSVFISGLDNNLLKKVLKQQKPNTIDNAYNLIKHIKPDTNSNVFKLQSVNDNINCSCNEQIKVLTTKIDYLQSLIITMQKSLIHKHTYNKQFPNQKPQYYNNNNQQQQRRTNQNHTGNTARQPPRCYNCQRPGHIARNCRNNVSRFRNVYESDNSSIRVDENVSNISDQYSHSEGNNFYKVQSAIETNNSTPIVSQKQTEKASYKTVLQRQLKFQNHSLHTSKYSDDILQIEQYVNDKSSFNKQCLSFADSQPMTVITKRNKELARNKPIIIGTVQNTKAKIFLDTGADINLVDKTFIFQHLKMRKGDLRPTSSSVKCANGGNLDVLGEIDLNVHIGSSMSRETFLVANKVFPDVIIGLVGMNRMSIAMCPAESCAFTGNKRVAFLSKVLGGQKNEQQLHLRTGMKLVK